MLLDTSDQDFLFHKIFERGANGIVIAESESGTINLVNDSFAKMFGYEKKEMVGMHFTKLHFSENEEIAPTGEFESLSINEKRKLNDIKCVKKDGSEFFVSIDDTKIIQDGIAYNIAFFTDITAKYELEKALIESEKSLQQSIATKDLFISIIAHDLKNPINSISGLANILNLTYDGDNQKMKDVIRMIGTSSKKTLQLLDNLLQWAQSQSGNIELNAENINLCLLIEEAILQVQNAAFAKEIEINTDFKADIEVYGDKNTITTVIRNLLSNAIKFTERKKTIYIITKKISKESKPKVEICIEDEGVGMHPDVLNNLFNVSKNQTTKGTEKEEGTGLGLLLCKDFVTMNNGTISAESTLGKGSRFFVSLPVAK